VAPERCSSRCIVGNHAIRIRQNVDYMSGWLQDTPSLPTAFLFAVLPVSSENIRASYIYFYYENNLLPYNTPFVWSLSRVAAQLAVSRGGLSSVELCGH
jgi:hypothetical protein